MGNKPPQLRHRAFKWKRAFLSKLFWRRRWRGRSLTGLPACCRRANGGCRSRSAAGRRVFPFVPETLTTTACSSPSKKTASMASSFPEWSDIICCSEMGLEVVDLRALLVIFFYFLFSSHVGIQEDAAFQADILDLYMQNMATLLFWWLASNLELAYPSEVYCNLSLMIGVPVIDGGLQAATTPLRLPGSLLPSAGEGIKIFEMCFDHQCSQKALTLHCPEMKGIRLGWGSGVGWGGGDLSPFTGDVLFVFFIL